MYIVPKNSIKSIKNMVEDSDKAKTGSVKVDVLWVQAVLLQLSSNKKLFSKFKGFKHLLGTLFTWKSHFEKAMCFYNASKIFGKSCDLELCFYEKDQSSKNCSGQNQWIIQVSLYFSEYILSKHLLYLFREYVHISLYIHRVIVLAHP